MTSAGAGRATAKISHGKPEAVARLKPGKVAKFSAAGDTGMSYHVYVPTSFDTNAIPPIIIAFSPGGSGMQMVNGKKDGGANSWAKRDKDTLEDRDCEVRIFTHPGGHRIAPANVTDEAIAWLEQEWKDR